MNQQEKKLTILLSPMILVTSPPICTAALTIPAGRSKATRGNPLTLKKKLKNHWITSHDQMGLEGLVVYSAGGIHKIKQEYEIDAAIVTINKNDDFTKNRGTSVRHAVIVKENTYLEIGDAASGITHELRSILWQYKVKFALDTTNERAYVEPFFVVKILATDFSEHETDVWELRDGKRTPKGTMAESLCNTQE